MTTSSEPTTLPEYANNPFIRALPPLLSAKECLETLASRPEFKDEERTYPAHIRAHCLQRLNHYLEPLEQHLQLEMIFSTLIRQGYLGRNPRD